MKKSVYAWSILLTLAVGMLAGFLIRDDVSFYLQSVKKPALTPPAWVFPAVWTVLYVLMAWGLARVLVRAGQRAVRSRALTLYVAQLFFNFFWSILFFHVRAYLLSLVGLAILWRRILARAALFPASTAPQPICKSRIWPGSHLPATSTSWYSCSTERRTRRPPFIFGGFFAALRTESSISSQDFQDMFT